MKELIKSENKKTAVIDPEFWTTLNPKLEFNNAEKTVDGFNAFSIAISPDPSKTEDEVLQASSMMQGTVWRSMEHDPGDPGRGSFRVYDWIESKKVESNLS